MLEIKIMNIRYLSPILDVLEIVSGQSLMTSSPSGQFYLDNLHDDGNDF